MKLSGLMKLVKSRGGVLSVMLAILCGLLLGLIACHLYNLKKVEGFSQDADKDADKDTDITYKFNVEFDDSDPKSLDGLKHKMSSKTKKDKKTAKHVDTHSAVSHESPGTKVQMNADSLNDFYRQLPQGIPRHEIPDGDEDLYILKSEIVPPVCPACPSFDCPREKPCPACPACERCPEPAFECKKVPNYSVSNVDNYLPSASNFFGMSEINSKQPRPVLNDFSQFN